MQLSLPSELWMQIASSLSTNDLAHLCITSSRFCHVIRPFLYRHVVIQATSQSITSDVLALLARDTSLAKYVVKLTLARYRTRDHIYDSPRIRTRPSLINVDALTNMVSLKRVVIYGSIFRSAHEQNEFGRILAPGSGISLDELTCIVDGSEDFPGDRFGDVGGLRKLYWSGNSLEYAYGSIEPMWHILSRSTSTINTLSLPFDLCLDDDNLPLWNMRFPHLCSFSLGFWKHSPGFEPAESDRDFLDFILAHSDTIQVLDLEYDGYDDNVFMFDDLSWERLQPSSLPHLHSLRGHLSTIDTFFRARLDCLRTTLRRLAVGPGMTHDTFDTLLSPEIGSGPALGPLLALQEIELQLYGWDQHIQWHELVKIIQRCARCCPSLEVWRGTLPRGFKICAKSLGRLFGLFNGLELIYLHQDTVFLGPYQLEEDEVANDVEEEGGTEDNTSRDSTIKAYVHTLALSCGALKNVSVRRSYPMQDWWAISRTRNSIGESVCSLSCRTIEERDMDMPWISQSGEKRSFNHWIHTP